MSCCHSDPRRLAAQYGTDENLRVRAQTHERYTVGPSLESSIRAALALRGDEALLDVGTGPGGWPGALRRKEHRGRLVGVDASAGMIQAARTGQPGVEFLVADAQQLPFDDHSFDLVTARHMLYHVPNIPAALKEARRMLKPAGRFFAVTNAADYMGQYRDIIREAANLLSGRIADEVRSLADAPISSTFTDLTGPPLVRDAFGNVSVTSVESQLRFDSADPVVRYFDSSRTMKDLTIEEWANASGAVRRVVEQRLQRGPLLVSKHVVLMLAFQSL